MTQQTERPLAKPSVQLDNDRVIVTATRRRPHPGKGHPHRLMGRDVLGCAQTGTGKTASFTCR
jgi:hypothetical protein